MARRPRPPERWRGELGERRLEVELTVAGVGTQVRLLSDGLEVDRRRASIESATELEGPGLTVHVRWGLTGRPAAITARAENGTTAALAPPPGSRRARLEDWGARHPGLWRSRGALRNLLALALGILALAIVVWFFASGLALDLLPFWLPVLALVLIVIGLAGRGRRARGAAD